MVVDDDLDTNTTIKTILEKNNYRVITAVSYNDCLKKLKTTHPHLILIESFMSKGKILKIADQKRIKIAYLITEKEEKEDLKLYKNVIGFIEEPRDIKQFIKNIKKLIN